MKQRPAIVPAPVIASALLLLALTSCQSWRRDDGASTAAGSSQAESTSEAPRRKRARSHQPPIRQLVCLYDQKPWISVDAAGDRDPEGVRFRIFLDGGSGKGVLRDGTFHVELYRVVRNPEGTIERTLASDWHYHSSAVTTVEARMLGKGYLMQLRWANKDLAGNEIELITRFEDDAGREIRGGTKRLRIPKYTS